MTWLSKLFKNKVQHSQPIDPGSALNFEGYKSFEKGKEYFINRQTAEALKHFDLALEKGYEENFNYNVAELYDMRAACLQELEYHYDSIIDFDKAILLSPQNCNRYFLRSISKRAILDFYGEIDDLNKAIEISKQRSAQNGVYNDEARKTGYNSAAGMFEFNLTNAETNLISEINTRQRIADASPETKHEMEEISQKWKQKRLQSVKRRT